MPVNADLVGRMIAQISLGIPKQEMHLSRDAEALYDQLAAEIQMIKGAGFAAEPTTPDLPDLGEPNPLPGGVAAGLGPAGGVPSHPAVTAAAPAPKEAGAMPWQVTDSEPSCDGYAVVNKDSGKVEGCHDARADAEAHAAALYANTQDERAQVHAAWATTTTEVPAEAAAALATVDPDAGRYAFTLAFEDQPTLEAPAREFKGGVLTWDQTPFPLKWQEAEAPGHEGAVIVGRVDAVWREPGQLRGVLQFDTQGSNGAEAHRLIQGRYLKGGSLLADDITDADVEFVYPAAAGTEGDDGTEGDGDGGGLLDLLGPPPERVVFHSGRIRSWTLVAEPAFAAALVETPTGPDQLVALAATSQAFEVDNSEWDGNAAMTSCTTAACYRAICAGRKAGPPDERGSWALPHHKTEGGPPNANGVRNALSALPKTQGLQNTDQARRHLEAHLSAIQASALVAAAATVTIPDVPPAWWFSEPAEAPPIGGLCVTPEGRVYGYLAPFGIAHRGFDARIEAPRGTVDYSDFLNKPAFVTGEDEEVVQLPAGNITMACGHAPTLRRDARVGPEYYDNSCSVAARIRVGENGHGVWVAGALLPDVDATQVQRMLACELSGDWEPHRDRPGWQRLVAAHLVPTGGLPKAQADQTVRVRFRDGQLVASAVPVRLGPDLPPADELTLRRRRLADRIAASVGRDSASRRQALAARVHPSQGGPRA